MTAMRLYEPDACGRDGYPPEWHEHIKHQVREDAGHRCVRCRHPYRTGESPPEWSPCDRRCHHRGPIRWSRWGKEPFAPHEPTIEAGVLVGYGHRVEAAWRILTVHHLDGVKANCRWWNLAPLCQRCHLQIQGRVQMERVWPWEHTEWFKPYAAGYYAWTYLRQDLTSAETEARLDELLDLERMVA